MPQDSREGGVNLDGLDTSIINSPLDTSQIDAAVAAAQAVGARVTKTQADIAEAGKDIDALKDGVRDIRDIQDRD